MSARSQPHGWQSEGAFAAAWAEVMTMTLEQVLTEYSVKPDTL